MKNKNLDIAIVIVAFNRIEGVKRLLSSLLGAYYSQPATLIISVDKSDSTVVEEYSDKFMWPYGDKLVVKHPKNLGLRRHILSIGDYTKQYDGVIVLEDDLEVAPSFYNYALETVKKYQDDDRIAGISLYSFPINLQNSLPFIPEHNEYDAFLFQNAQSWGQIWMPKTWAMFRDWYDKNSDEFSDQPHLPYSICHWGKNSWLKYHIKFCIEQDKYFVYPYISLSFCSGAAGVHSKEVNNYSHNAILHGNFTNFRLPDFGNAIKYDGFYERVGLERELPVNDVCVDLNGSKGNRMNHRYWLTTKCAPFKIIKSYGLKYIPIEQNIIRVVEGEAIFLYDTHEKSKAPVNNFSSIFIFYKFNALLSYMRMRGFVQSTIQLALYILKKIK